MFKMNLTNVSSPGLPVGNVLKSSGIRSISAISKKSTHSLKGDYYN